MPTTKKARWLARQRKTELQLQLEVEVARAQALCHQGSQSLASKLADTQDELKLAKAQAAALRLEVAQLQKEKELLLVEKQLVTTHRDDLLARLSR